MLAEEIMKLVKDAATELGKELDVEAVKVSARQQAKLLAVALREPGYRKALISARNTVALAGGIDIVAAADAADQKILGVIEGALGVAARILGGIA